MDPDALRNFIQEAGIKDYTKAKELSQIRDREKLVGKLMEDSDVRKNYNKGYDLDKAMKDRKILY